jgi:ribosomal protein S18 acetylase RimI-like enzyme
MDDRELARRSIEGFAETLAAVGRTGVGGATEVRERGLVGARVPWAQDDHWIDAAVGIAPRDAGDALPHCCWSEQDGNLPDVAMPCMGLVLDEVTAPPAPPAERPPLAVVGAMNDRAYGRVDRLAPIIAALADDRIVPYGLRVDGVWACVAAAVRLADDVSIQYVATEEGFRRRGLATRLLVALLADARAHGLHTATLQASPDGRPVYERLGFRTVATLHATVR